MAKLKELADFYTRAAAMKDPVIKLDEKCFPNSPSVNSDMTRWTVEERQPDFQCLIDSGIDCEFSDDLEKKWYVGKLKRVSCREMYVAHDDSIWMRCRPRLNHIHAWVATEDSKCPVPDGYKVKIFADGEWSTPYSPGKFSWGSVDWLPITAFEVLPK